MKLHSGRALLAAAMALAVVACGDSQPVPGPGLRAAPAAGLLGTASITHVHYRDRAELARLAANHDALEKVDLRARTVSLLLTESEREQLRRAGFELSVDTLATERLLAKARLAAQPRPPYQRAGISGFACYRTVEETHDALRALQAAHPDLVEIRDIGDSWVKQNPNPLNTYGTGYDLLVARLTQSARPGPKPVFFLFAATHARELPTAELVLRFAEQLAAGYGVDADLTWLLDHTEIHILPLANPDARKYAEQGQYWRKNVNAAHCPVPSIPALATDGSLIGQGVDLNRNMPYQWGGAVAEEVDGASSAVDCMGSYRGTGPASEPENIAVTDYMAQVFPAARSGAVTEPVSVDTPGLFISVHNAASLNIFPWGYTEDTPAPDFGLMRSFNRKLSHYNGYTACWDCLYPSNGTHDDYSYAEHGVMSTTIELTDGDFFESCDSFESQTLPTNLKALLFAAKAAVRPYALARGPETLEVSLTPAVAKAGVPVVLNAQADDTRYAGYTDAELASDDLEPAQPVTAMRYSLGEPSWVSGTPTSALAAADGGFDSAQESGLATLDTSKLSAGRHLVFVESQDADGNWGVPTAAYLEIAP